MSGEEYFRRIAATVDQVKSNLTASGVEARHIGFGGEGIRPTGKPRVPAGGIAIAVRIHKTGPCHVQPTAKRGVRNEHRLRGRTEERHEGE